MRILIAYVGQTGSTEKVAGILSEKLENAPLIDLRQKSPDISKYDFIIIGSNVRFGRLHKKARDFIAKNKNILLEKKVAYFICCGFSEKKQEYFEESISNDLLEKAIIYDSFGGELNIDQQKGINKLIVKMVNKATNGKNEVKFLYDNIDHFAKVINKCIRR